MHICSLTTIYIYIEEGSKNMQFKHASMTLMNTREIRYPVFFAMRILEDILHYYKGQAGH